MAKDRIMGGAGIIQNLNLQDRILPRIFSLRTLKKGTQFMLPALLRQDLEKMLLGLGSFTFTKDLGTFSPSSLTIILHLASLVRLLALQSRMDLPPWQHQ